MRMMIAGLVALVVSVSLTAKVPKAPKVPDGVPVEGEDGVRYSLKKYGDRCLVSSFVSEVDRISLFCSDESDGPREQLWFFCTRGGAWDKETESKLNFGVIFAIPELPDGLDLFSGKRDDVYVPVDIPMRTPRLGVIPLTWTFNLELLAKQQDSYSFAMHGDSTFWVMTHLQSAPGKQVAISYRIAGEIGHMLLPSEIDKAVDDFIDRCGEIGSSAAKPDEP